ncbi:putative methyl-CpG DNA binding, DNA-binding domain superfamily [Helianthus anomalus]
MVIVYFKQYYIAPSGRRLRSKNEVLNFLETGSKRKKPPTQSSEDTPFRPLRVLRLEVKKKTTARKKVHAAFTFDFKNPPEKVSWRLTYASEDVWTPSIGDKNLPLATKQEWAAVFNHVCQN